MNLQEELKYNAALQSVHKIKKFYSHLIVYIFVTTIIIVVKTQKIDEGETIWHAFYAPLFWGIGLVLHALNVFDKVPFFNSEWEEKKVKQFMEEEKSEVKRYK